MYHPIQSHFGTLWLHRCAALDHGPEWTRRERLLIDAGATDSQLTFRGRSITFHAHLFKEADGQFRFTERSLPKCFQESLGFHSVFETHHQIISVADDDYIARSHFPAPSFDPQIEDVMQIHIGKQR